MHLDINKTNIRIDFGAFRRILTFISVANAYIRNRIIIIIIIIIIIGKFILYANIPYLYPHPTNPPTSLGNRGKSGILGAEAYVSDIWPLKNLGEFL